jgi:site-specific DNA-methyltransferase (adenine-specific)
LFTYNEIRNMESKILVGDCLERLKEIPDCSVDSVVTDPPYGLSFMRKRWDYDVPSVEVWAECLRVLKPGGHVLAFGGTRTQHRMAVRIEDAGFEIRDIIAWVYGSGFPKSHNLDGKWDGWGTALKPALEPITVARKPLVGAVASNVLEYGTGALNIDGCRVEPTGESRERVGEPSQERRYTDAGGTNFAATPGIRGGNPSGRWPANLIHDGSDEVTSLLPTTMSASEKYGTRSSSTAIFGSGQKIQKTDARGGSGIGSAARFFYCAKASKRDRGEGNNHPTVKPTDLMRYLCRLVTPPGGLVLDPFMGSGSTGKAASLEQFRFVGIEREAQYAQIAENRISAVSPLSHEVDLHAPARSA